MINLSRAHRYERAMSFLFVQSKRMLMKGKGMDEKGLLHLIFMLCAAQNIIQSTPSATPSLPLLDVANVLLRFRFL